MSTRGGLTRKRGAYNTKKRGKGKKTRRMEGREKSLINENFSDEEGGKDEKKKPCLGAGGEKVNSV